MIGIGEPLYHNEPNSSPSANMSQSSEMQHLQFENQRVKSNLFEEKQKAELKERFCCSVLVQRKLCSFLIRTNENISILMLK